MRPYPRLFKCIVCGCENEFYTLASASYFYVNEYPFYLDGTPVDKDDYSVQYCEKCGYCARNLEDDEDRDIDTIKRVIKTRKYREIFAIDNLYSAKYHLCNSFISLAHRDFHDALINVKCAISTMELFKEDLEKDGLTSILEFSKKYAINILKFMLKQKREWGRRWLSNNVFFILNRTN